MKNTILHDLTLLQYPASLNILKSIIPSQTKKSKLILSNKLDVNTFYTTSCNQQKMQEIDFESSEDLNDSYSNFTFRSAQLNRDQVFDLTLDEIIDDRPTQQEITSTISAIRLKFPSLCIRAIITKLYKKFHADSHAPQKTKHFARQCQYAAKSFVLLGYGIARMRKQIIVDNVSLNISDAREYDRVINRVFMCAYRQLQQFISSKCDRDEYGCKMIPIKDEPQMKSLLQIMRNARRQMGSNDLHCYFKLLKSTYETYAIKLSKKEACSLYKSIHKWMDFKKGKGCVQQLQQYQQQSLQLDMNQLWSQQMKNALIQNYIQNHSSLTNLQLSLKNRFPQCTLLIDPNSIKHQLAQVFREAIKRAQQQMDFQPCLQMGNRFKRMERLDQERVRAILSSPQSASVRTTLCQFYLLKQFDIHTLICVILSINQFVNKKESQKITQNLKKTMQVNSMVREEYAFSGKRNQVLVFKRNEKKKHKMAK